MEIANFFSNDFVCYDSNHCFLMKPEDFGFNEADIPILPEGKYCGVGSSKSIKTIRGAKQQRLMLSIVVDCKISFSEKLFLIISWHFFI